MRDPCGSHDQLTDNGGMRIALISDIHANALALEAVLADIAQTGVDNIFCLGDVATLGPDPRAVIDILRDRRIPCVMGNHDEFLLVPDMLPDYNQSPVIMAAVDWCRDLLRPEDLEFVRGFQREIGIPAGRDSSLLLFHGSPRSHMEMILASTPAAELDTILGGRMATVMVGGHTHIQMLRQHKGQWIVNAGSVGMPFREDVTTGPPQVLDHAEYATVEVRHGVLRVELNRVALSRKALHDAAAASACPMSEMLIAQYS